MINLKRLKRFNPLVWFQTHTASHVYDVIILGSSLSSLVAVLSAVSNHLSVCWLPLMARDAVEDTAPFTHSAGFDSLAPEGVMLLKSVLSNDELAQCTLGMFKGIVRSGEYQAFDAYLPCGIQYDTPQLKAVLTAKINRLVQQGKVKILSEVQLHSISQNVDHAELTVEEQPSIKGLFLLDGTGQKSTVTQQAVCYLSGEKWIYRRLISNPNGLNNEVEFIQNDVGWRWLASTEQGVLCETYWLANTHVESPELHQGFNCQWYTRRKVIEHLPSVNAKPHAFQLPRLILIGQTAFRFDPASGLGATLQFKSAIHAMTAIRHIKSQRHLALFYLKKYQQAMQSDQNDVYMHLSDFYAAYSS